MSSCTKTVNLYQVSDSEYEYCYFVFAESRNQAKQFCVCRNSNDETYISLRCKTLKKNADPEYFATVVESPCDKAYEYVNELGYGYIEED